ncbi:hypothetical protein HELRODRAFT_77983 [Helobdella robusta]|uniref:Condensin complex subunit 1 C-terminal domain-containing protein n=1 Tax=Helobdella robusta TaxID=6412 RepID=T1G360_HELRO|nr:hypothetical protein HELRODRAFT_77983 [Helobdella robusta]ESO05159.1 hypothetical protein HELRODRAFT_77983 [Helobdella robusta]
MAKTIISAKYPPLIDPTRATLAFGRKALPVLKRDLESPVLLLKQRSMMSLSDYLHDPEHIAEALRQGFIDLLLSLMHDSDSVIRHKCAECFYLFANHSIGRQALVENHSIPYLVYLLDDEKDIVRLTVYKAIEMLSKTLAGIAILEANLVKLLLNKMLLEPDEMKYYILDTLHFCFKINVQEGLDNQGMNIFNDYLHNHDQEIRWRGARNIADLCQVLEGKNQAIEIMCVYPLIGMLSESNENIKVNATYALMMIAITTKGKYTVLEAQAIPPLIRLLQDKSSQVRVNSLKTITCLAESPEGRQVLLDHVPQIKELQCDALPSISRAATIAINKILWKP